MAKAGIHADFIRLFVNLNTMSQRFVKISDTFSSPIQPFNALGQGDPWVLLCAILYVSSQFKMVQQVAPSVKSIAVIDDRSLQGPPDQLHLALCRIFAFDILAGHLTHPEKITLTACTKKDLERIAKWVFDGFKPPIVQTQRLVGDVVTTLKNGARQLATSRLEFAIRTAARIKAADTSVSRCADTGC